MMCKSSPTARTGTRASVFEEHAPDFGACPTRSLATSATTPCDLLPCRGDIRILPAAVRLAVNQQATWDATPNPREVLPAGIPPECGLHELRQRFFHVSSKGAYHSSITP